MFEFFRKSKFIQIALFLVLILAFAVVGVEGYSRFREQGDVVAVVDGQNIRQPDWDAAHKTETDRVRQSMPNLDPKLLDSPEAKYATLERLVRERVVSAAANKLHLTTSDQRLARDLQENPSIAALRKADGSLDVEAYKQLVGAQGMSPEMFEARVRQDLSARQVLTGISTTGLTSAALADQALAAYFERREVQLLRLNAADFASKVSPSDAQIEQYYKTNPQLFQAPETANIEYLVLDLDSAKKGLSLKPEDVKAYYDQNAARLSGQEERRASHILINAPKNAPAGERSAARAKAEALLVEAKKSPAGFADLAKKNSQDPGSAANGGDLDFFARGAMVKPFEDAAYAMKKGDISDVVESDFGYHIIRLTDIKAPRQKSFEEMKPEIEADLLKEQAKKKFAELAEAFTDSVYTQPEALTPTAERLKLEIRTANNLSRTPAPTATGAISNARFLSAIFSADSVEKKRNTQAIETGANQLISGRILQHTPARTLPLAEVKDRVRERLVASQAAELAKKEGEAKLKAWQTAPASASGLSENITVARDQAQRLPAPLIDASLRADASKLPVFVGVDLGAQGYAVVRINKVLEREPKGGSGLQDRQQVNNWWANAEGMAYYEALKQRFKTEILVRKPVAQTEDVPTAQ
jgi:peptidyl-prolyl cis-trans isomerase D